MERARFERRGSSLIALLSWNDKENEALIKKEVFGLNPEDPWSERLQKSMDEDISRYLTKGRIYSRIDLSDYMNHLRSDIQFDRNMKRDHSEFLFELLRKDMKKLSADSLLQNVLKKIEAEHLYKDLIQKKEQKKYEYVLVDEDGYETKWTKEGRVWAGEDGIAEIYKSLPKYMWHEKRVIRLLNKKDLTMKALYNFLVKEMGREFANQALKEHLGMTVKKQEVYQ